MRIEKIKINNGNFTFEEPFSPNDNLICVLDNEKIFRTDYKNSFKKNMLDLFRVGSYTEGVNFFTEVDINLLNGQKYTLSACGERKNENCNSGQKGFTNVITRSYYENETTGSKNSKKNKAKTKCRIEELFDLSHSPSIICFEDDKYEDSDLFEYSFLWGKYDDEIENIASEYFKENLPITFSNGDVLYMREPSNKNNNKWEIFLVDKHGEKYDCLYNSTGINLMFFIIMNNLVQILSNKVKEDFSYPMFILDSFDYVEKEYFEEIMKQLKNLNRQVFIILREPNKSIQEYCDKTIEYYCSDKK